MVTETNNNGHKDAEQIVKGKVFEGALVTLDQLKHQDGLLAESIDKGNQQRLGVVQRAITAVNDDKEYRQILKLGRWRSQEHIDRTLNAIHACRTCGAEKALRFIFDKVTAESAGLNAEGLREAFEALTHTSTTYNWQNQGKGKQRNDPSYPGSHITQ